MYTTKTRMSLSCNIARYHEQLNCVITFTSVVEHIYFEIYIWSIQTFVASSFLMIRFEWKELFRFGIYAESMISDIVEHQIKEEVAKEFGNFTNDSAMMIAYERGLETKRGLENALFQDPFARNLGIRKKDSTGEQIVEHSKVGGSTLSPSLETA